MHSSLSQRFAIIEVPRKTVHYEEGYPIKTSGLTIRGILAGMAILCLVPRLVMKRFRAHSSHTLDVVAATAIGTEDMNCTRLRRLPEIHASLEGNYKAGYSLVLSNCDNYAKRRITFELLHE
ncbi:hypothetical protein DL89DRAFT_281516 [Linderina pennispora]|uniref:Uncharacterized protein n=1 Tax=Linderina pennispora TaxID=61395 RepID=A0A1Y1WH59_9FUNG|nr:uncharacterized protein DL89DRAFT_281516 [Linderina pennispora]ORX72802.1 hypothetical protein DL89DRAFT_281516 [Linderina pennispora]